MAQIDLKNADIFLRDGYNSAGALNGAVDNNPSGYSAGATTMTVDGITGEVAVGDIFYMDALPLNRYTISAETPTLGNTTSITFSPGLIADVADDDTFTIAPHQVEVKVGEGNLSFVEKRAVVYTLDRGALDEVKLGDEEPVEVSLDFTWVWLYAASGEAVTIEDALKNRNGASAWVSSDSDTCRPYALDLVIENVPPCSDGTKAEVITLADFRYEQLSHDAKAGAVAMTGKCNITEASSARVTI